MLKKTVKHDTGRINFLSETVRIYILKGKKDRVFATTTRLAGKRKWM